MESQANVQTPEVLSVAGLSVNFGAEPVLEDVSFTLRRGEFATLIGPNGSGKTTLFKALMGLIPYHGSVVWAPDVTTGYVPQRFTVPRTLPVSVEEFFQLKSAHFWLPGAAFSARVVAALALVGLEQGLLEEPLGALSGGQLQRVLVSWALLDWPAVLLFDEPASSVDIGFGETIHQLIHRMCQERGTTVLLISHDLHVVSRYADRVLCLNRRLLCEGPPIVTLTPARLGELFGEVGVYPHLHAHG